MTGGGPGLDGMGGTPNAGEGLRGGGAGGPGVGPRTAGGRPGGGAVPEEGLRCDGGLTERQDLNVLNKGKMHFCYYYFITIKRSCV